MNVVEVLEAGRELISDPTRWTRGSYGRDVNGDNIAPYSKEAVCFCSAGALYRVGNKNNTSIMAAYNILKDAMGSDIEYYNDNSSHEDVLKAWDKAIDMAKANT